MTAAACRTLGCGSLGTYLDTTIAARAAWVEVRTTTTVPPRWYCGRVCAAAALVPDTLRLVWGGTVSVPGPGGAGAGALVDLVTATGGAAVLVLDAGQRIALAGLLDAEVRDIARACPTLGCGVDADDVDESDPALWGWTQLRVGGSATPLRWYCKPGCVHDALARAGAELAAADMAAGYDPAPAAVGHPRLTPRPPHEDESLPPVLREALRVMSRRGPVVELTAGTTPSEGVAW